METLSFVPVFNIQITDAEILEYLHEEEITEAPRNKDGSLNMRLKQNREAKDILFYKQKNALLIEYHGLIEQKKQEKIKEMLRTKIDTTEDCPICMEDMKGRAILNCNHVFCIKCSIEHFRQRTTCPLCRAKVCEEPEKKTAHGGLVEGIVNENLLDIYPERHNYDLYNFILSNAVIFKNNTASDAYIFTREIFEEVRKFGLDVGEDVKQWFEN